MNRTKFLEFLQDNLEEIQDDLGMPITYSILLMDPASYRRSPVIRQYLDDAGIPCIIIPASSPDLNVF